MTNILGKLNLPIDAMEDSLKTKSQNLKNKKIGKDFIKK